VNFRPCWGCTLAWALCLVITSVHRATCPQLIDSRIEKPQEPLTVPLSAPPLDHRYLLFSTAPKTWSLSRVSSIAICSPFASYCISLDEKSLSSPSPPCLARRHFQPAPPFVVDISSPASRFRSPLQANASTLCGYGLLSVLWRPGCNNKFGQNAGLVAHRCCLVRHGRSEFFDEASTVERGCSACFPRAAD
jgi:hypothetical protein